MRSYISDETGHVRLQKHGTQAGWRYNPAQDSGKLPMILVPGCLPKSHGLTLPPDGHTPRVDTSRSRSLLPGMDTCYPEDPSPEPRWLWSSKLALQSSLRCWEMFRDPLVQGHHFTGGETEAPCSPAPETLDSQCFLPLCYT